MKSSCTKVLSFLCLILFLVQVIFGYSNNDEMSNLNSICAVVFSGIEPNTDTPKQEEQEEQAESQESQESEENEETEELEVSLSNLANQKECLQVSDMNYYYLFRPSEGIIKEQYYPPRCKV